MSDYDSDGLVFSEPELSSPARNNRIGEKSIEQIFEHAQEDRISSKRTTKQLRFGNGAPSTRFQQSLWVRRFEAFRQTSLKQDVKRPFTGDDLIRFFDSILSKMATVQSKPAPNKNTILNGVKFLLAYGIFNWAEKDGFKIDGHDSSRFRAWLDKAIRTERLTRGTWKKRTWIGYAVLSRLVRTYLARGIEHGTLSWDVTIAKCLSLVLVSSLGARTGDVARSRLYREHEYMQYRHIELYIEGDQPIFANLRATVTVEYAKGHKTERNADSIRLLRPLNDTHNSHMCPIALLLVHCLRHSLVQGTTLQEVLDRAVRSPDRMVEWSFPKRPVLAAFAAKPLRCDLDKPASPGQLLLTIKKMGVVAGMLDRAYGHALRLGTARDVGHLSAKDTDSTGQVTESVRQTLGHKHSTVFSGATDNYVGGSSAEIWNHRAVSAKEPKGRQVRFASGSSTRNGEPIPEARGQTSKMLADPSPLPPSSAYTTARPRRPLAAKDVNAPLAGSRAPETIPRLAVPEGNENIDPALLDDEQITVLAEQISEAAVLELEATILPPGAQSGEGESTASRDEEEVVLDRFNATDAEATLVAAADDNAEQEAAILLDADDEAANTSMAGPEEFIARYAKYNTVDNNNFARRWLHTQGESADDVVAQYCMVGGSRDYPQPMVHSCNKTPGCSFTTIDRNALRSHHEHCDKLKAEQLSAGADRLSTMLACTYKDCNFVAAPMSNRPGHTLQDHVRNVHKFEAKACEHGCEPNKTYYDQSKYQYHLSTRHSERWPARCTFPNCTHGGTFANHASLKYHLKNAHKLDDAAVAHYIPALPPKLSYIPQLCVMDGCTVRLSTFAQHTMHLRGPHKLDKDQAHQMVEERAQFEMKTPQPKVGNKRAPTTKSTKLALETGGPPLKKTKASARTPTID